MKWNKISCPEIAKQKCPHMFQKFKKLNATKWNPTIPTVVKSQRSQVWAIFKRYEKVKFSFSFHSWRIPCGHWIFFSPSVATFLNPLQFAFVWGCKQTCWNIKNISTWSTQGMWNVNEWKSIGRGGGQKRIINEARTFGGWIFYIFYVGDSNDRSMEKI